MPKTTLPAYRYPTINDLVKSLNKYYDDKLEDLRILTPLYNHTCAYFSRTAYTDRLEIHNNGRSIIVKITSLPDDMISDYLELHQNLQRDLLTSNFEFGLKPRACYDSSCYPVFELLHHFTKPQHGFLYVRFYLPEAGTLDYKLDRREETRTTTTATLHLVNRSTGQEFKREA